jgi:NADH-quinone oxidoreductase subunit N
MTTLTQLAPELSILLTALLVLFIDVTLTERIKKALPYVAICGVLISLVLALAQWGPTNVIASVLVHDSVTIFTFGLICITMMGLILISVSFMYQVSDNVPLYFVLLLLNGLAAMLMTASTNILMVILSLEFLSLTSYVLTGFLHYNTRSTEAAVKYLLYGAVISALMLYGVSWLYGLTGQTDYAKIAESLLQPGQWFSGQAFSPMLLLPTVIFISTGFAFKIAAAPFHQWAPDAYEGAPTPVTALLATIPKIAGFVVIYRISMSLFPANTSVGKLWHDPLLGLLSATAMIIGSLGGLWQTDVKRMMAYSGITQAGYALMGLAIGSSQGVQAQFVYLFAYVLAELAAFAVITNLHVRLELTDLAEYQGLYQRSPVLAVIMLIALLSLTGLPGTVGFIGKFTLFSASIERDYVWLAVIGVINTVISFAYYWKLIRVMWLETSETLPAVQIRKATIPVLLLTVTGIIGLGIFPDYLLRVIELVLQHLR